MPIPDISQGHRQPTDLPYPSDGPLAKQRHANQDYREQVGQDKYANSDEDPPRFVPGSGPPGENNIES